MRKAILAMAFVVVTSLDARAAPTVYASIDGLTFEGTNFSALATDGTVWTARQYDPYMYFYPLCGDNFGGVADIAPGVVKQVPGLKDVVAVSGSTALKADGTVWSWQYMTYTRTDKRGLGIDLIELPLKAEPVPGLDNVSQIAGSSFISYGYGFSYAVKKDGTVWRWKREIVAYDTQHPCYFQAWPLTPIEQVAGIDQVVSLKISRSEVVALKSDGSVWTWKHTQSTPRQMAGLDGVTAVFAGGWDNGFAIKSDGSVFGWGDNTYIQLGISPMDILGSATPIAMPALGNDVKQVVVGGGYVGAVKQDGSVWAWGSSTGQICPEGDTPCPDRNAGYIAPVKLRGVSNDFLSISAGGSTFTIVKSDGSIYVIGRTGSNIGLAYDNSLAQGGAYYFSLFPSLNLLTPPPKSDTDRILDWAEQDYASLFAPAGIATRGGAGYTFRYYPQTDTYLGTKDGRVWFLPPGAPLSGIADVGAQADRLGEAKVKGF
ncbi:MAG: hypothetical protein KGZ83_21315 [Sulfuricella sp.]|nr:hypothetical protein [Sulfuricella sp.]